MRGGAFKRYFLTGLFVLLPIGASALFVIWLFKLMDSWATPLTQRFFGHHIPGLGLIFTVTVIFFTGVLSSNVIGRWVLGIVDHLFMDVPIFKTIYNTTKQVMQIFSPAGTHSFRSVVLVENPKTSILSLGFVTHELTLELGGEAQPYLAVYVPSNHVYLGDIFLFKKDQVHSTPLTIQQGIQCIISAGAALPADLKAETYIPKT